MSHGLAPCGELLLRSRLGGVQHRENTKAASVNLIGNDIGRARHDEFACLRFAAGIPEMGMLGKPFHGIENPLSQSARSHRLVLLDILPDFDEVGDGRFGPDYLHHGGDSSRFLPQDRSQPDASS
jgi:hypothetical protein